MIGIFARRGYAIMTGRTTACNSRVTELRGDPTGRDVACFAGL